MTRSLFRGSVFGVLFAAALAACHQADGAEKAPPQRPANVPKEYKLLYSQGFDEAAAIKDFEFTTANKWKISSLPGKDKQAPNGCLECLGPGKYRPKVRSPLIIALIRGRLFEDFILEADLCQTGREYGHRDMCLFFGFTDASKFYYVHMATKADNHAHNVFIVNDKPRTKIARKTTKGVKWGKDVWHHVRLERKGSDGTIKVFYDDMTAPIMEASDKTFRTGCVGFGSFDDAGRVDNVRIWGPKVTEKKTSFFKKPAKPKAR